MYDVGAGAEVTVLRRDPAGYEALADPAAGGAAIDHARTIARTGGQEAPGDGTGYWTLAHSVRTAKDALAAHQAVTVLLPDRPPVIANSAMLDNAARPALQRVAQLTTEAIVSAALTAADLAGISCVGGSAPVPHGVESEGTESPWS